MTVQERAIRERPSYDEGMAYRRPCPCGRHLISGAWSRLYCPWQPPHQGLHAQPDAQEGVE